MIHYLQQRTVASIVIEPSLHVSPKPVERGGAIAFVGSAWKVVDAHLAGSVQIPSGFGVERRNMAAGTFALALHDRSVGLGKSYSRARVVCNEFVKK